MVLKKNTIIVILLLFGTWLVVQNSSTVNAVPIKQQLASFPKTIGQWHKVHATTSSAEVVEMLGVDDEIHYTYQNEEGRLITLYVGYYKAVGVSGAYHSPKNCLPGGGWGIDSIQTFPLRTGIEGNSRSEVSEMLIRNGNKYQIVLYWYQNRGRIIASEYWEKIYLVFDALRIRRRDGTFVRIMYTVPNDKIVEASEEAGKFAELVMTNLESYLPGKKI
ncbi:MAG TPA: EpsI family protein [Desulfobacterales bacterium]|nr:EpsI family protein [Desulfobacterales bacterium]HIP37910.1 EpsI family protein [Desulfocapsa sulfexigens]